MTGCGRSALTLRKGHSEFAGGVDVSDQYVCERHMTAAARVPCFHHAAHLSSQGMVTAVPVSRTTIVCGFAAATCSISAS